MQNTIHAYQGTHHVDTLERHVVKNTQDDRYGHVRYWGKWRKCWRSSLPEKMKHDIWIVQLEKQK